MPNLNVEIKARCADPGLIRKYLLDHQASFIGTDEQTDTYFNVPNGRLKLREGLIENNLIFYNRINQAGPKPSHFKLIKLEHPEEIKDALIQSCGIKIVVSKKREIFYIGNVKFHIDFLKELGTFIEIEAGNILSDKTEAELLAQCNYYMQEFRIDQKDLVVHSYSDLLLEKTETIL